MAGFDELLGYQQRIEGITRLTLVQFDNRYEAPIDNIAVMKVVGLDTSTYQPRGMTALTDTIRKRCDKDGWGLFVGANRNAFATAALTNIHAHDAATDRFRNQGGRGSNRAFNRKIRVMREPAPYSPDL